ncbi:helix-turn-helix domain-containing protein [Streptomyces sp. IBSBF 3136]|uniref:helix-turn-helix domain-containing protein n=1 Tax=Streptomyces sp. IBSBF 3136 TaxID=2903524 RepID=UPI002FDBCBF9
MTATTGIEVDGDHPGAARPDVARLRAMGLDILVTAAGPARLPRERAPHGQPVIAGGPHRWSARDRGEFLFVGLRGGGPALLQEPSVDGVLAPGDICFYDAHRPPSLDLPEQARTKTFLLSRDLLGLADRDLHRITGVPVSRDSRMGSLLSPFLSDLADTAVTARSAVADMLAWNAVNLLATLAAEHLREQGRPADDRSSTVSRILRFIDLNLGDADLSPDRIARAHHISVRYLHKLFADEGTTVGRRILQRRLEECRRELADRSRGTRTIAAVAGRWGFASATHFSRVFRATYGLTPREWRDSAAQHVR